MAVYAGAPLNHLTHGKPMVRVEYCITERIAIFVHCADLKINIAGSCFLRKSSGAARQERSELFLVTRRHSVDNETASVSVSGDWVDSNCVKIADEACEQTK